MIILGDGGYHGTGYVTGHQLFNLYPLQDLLPYTDLQIFNHLEGIQLEQLMSHLISVTQPVPW